MASRLLPAGMPPFTRMAGWPSHRLGGATGHHLLFGLAVQLPSEELAEQDDRRATTDAERLATRIG
jgi:hypothetical protein